MSGCKKAHQVREGQSRVGHDREGSAVSRGPLPWLSLQNVPTPITVIPLLFYSLSSRARLGRLCLLARHLPYFPIGNWTCGIIPRVFWSRWGVSNWPRAHLRSSRTWGYYSHAPQSQEPSKDQSRAGSWWVAKREAEALLSL